MELKEKQQLVYLLNQYMNELVDDNQKDIAPYLRINGSKAKYEHDRIIAAGLAIEVNRGLKQNWKR